MVRGHVPTGSWSFDFSKVPPGYQVEVSGHIFERVAPPADLANPDDGPRWRHRTGPDHLEPARLICFAQDKQGNPTFARWGRVVLCEGDILGYADPKVIHNLGRTGTVTLIDPEGQQYTPKDAAVYLDLSEPQPLQPAVAEGGDAPLQAPPVYHGLHRRG
jgi:hypothetical protein